MGVLDKLYSLQVQVNDIIDDLEDKEAVKVLEPVETIEVPDPNGARKMLLGMLGSGRKGEKVPTGEMFKYRFDDGPLGPMTFLAYPRGLAFDWDVIARGCLDVTGQLYAPYNYPSGKPAWNAEHLEANMPPDDVVEQRFKDYKGYLRAPVESWPEKWQNMWKKYH